MLNTISVMGRLTRDPELRQVSNANVCNFTLACDRDFKDKTSGERGTDFIDVVAWRATADFVNKFFTKGRTAVVHGRLQVRDWSDKDGVKRRSAEIVADTVYFGDSKPNDGSGNNAPSEGFVPNFNPNEMPMPDGSYPNGGFAPNAGYAPNQPQQGPYIPQQQGYQGGYAPNQNGGYNQGYNQGKR
ncbi:single-stranded DNA-binding protein [Bengtsoniella intestinalis]|uniref:single-stranded DNA-binding protein n=1 Tax=Bengtsoniella intestinalis TaxID=3073143 RepID=UPI00391EE1E6